ncbi:MAG: hypothetical protein ACYS0G_15700 [Planctomycetota bacterium]|jgi:hypothetical protein
MGQTPDILKGNDFAGRLREIFGDGLPVCPLEDPNYRRILIPALTGGELQFALLGLIGQALRMRGAAVTALMCDELLPACTLRKADHHESACTRWCHKNAGPYARALGLPHRWYGELISDQTRHACRALAAAMPVDELNVFQYRGIELGHHILRSLESFFKVGTADLEDPAVRAQARAFLVAAMYLVEISERALDELQIDKVFLDDGKKTDFGVVRAVARRRGIPVDVIGVGLRNTSVRFEIDRPPQPTETMPAWERWRRRPLSEAQERRLEKYLRRRERVPYEYRDARWHAEITDAAEVRRRLGLPPRADGTVLAMFPNVGFDTGKTKSDDAAFGSARKWVAATVDLVGGRAGHHLIIKCHPAEHHRRACDTVRDFVRERWPSLPPNVHLIESNTDISAHSVVRLADVVLVYTSTIAAEAAALGKPVILAGGGWHAGRGIATEARSPDVYRELIASILAGGHRPPSRRELGRRYAYTLFFRSDIPITHLKRQDIHVATLAITDPAQLAPGGDAAVNAICRGILFDAPFENPDVADPARAGVEACGSYA